MIPDVTDVSPSLHPEGAEHHGSKDARTVRATRRDETSEQKYTQILDSSSSKTAFLKWNSQHVVNSFPVQCPIFDSALFIHGVNKIIESMPLCRNPCLQGTESCKMKRTIGRISGKSSLWMSDFFLEHFSIIKKVSLSVIYQVPHQVLSESGSIKSNWSLYW